jgi:acylphosphatase
MAARAKTVARRYLVSGRVQGVGYRYFVVNQAQTLGIVGFVRNLDDGSVEVHAQGTPEQIANLEGALHIGPRMSDVRGVEVHEISASNWAGFRIH